MPAVGAPEPWATGDALSSGWAAYKANWAPLTLGYFVMAILGSVPGQLPGGLARLGVIQANTPGYWAVSIPLTLVGMLISTFFTAGFIRASLKTIRGESASFGDFFSGPNFLSFLGTAILSSLAIMVGLLLLLIVPGIILALGFFNAQFYCVDRRMGPIESLKASWDSTNGQKGDVFVFSLLGGLITLGGLLACCVGIFVAVPVVMVAHAIVYAKMSGTFSGGPASFGPPMGYGVGPPGYGGPPQGGGGYGGPPGY